MQSCSAALLPLLLPRCYQPAHYRPDHQWQLAMLPTIARSAVAGTRRRRSGPATRPSARCASLQGNGWVGSEPGVLETSCPAQQQQQGHHLNPALLHWPLLFSLC